MTLKKIVVVPLDERPCNMLFPERLFNNENLNIVRPEKLGCKKQPADITELNAFLKKECKDADGLILSVDMLIYGGLIPSRIHHETKETLLSRMEIIKEIRKENPNLLIYAFQVIMRCPNYSSSDEEPDYYEQYGKEIHDAGESIHKSRVGLKIDKPLPKLMEKIDPQCLNDYIARRETNRYMNVETLQYLRDGWLDALVIPQDDSAASGYAATDQASLRTKIKEYDMVDKVLVYPGADEVELTLISRMINVMNDRCPKVYIKYAVEKARDTVPLYEGLPLAETLKYHILSAGCQQTESYEQADFILAVTAPADQMQEAADQLTNQRKNYEERNLPELIEFIRERIRERKIVSIADNAYANGGDIMFIHLLDKNDLLMKVGGYAGWNTSANTIGTAIAEAVDMLYNGKSAGHKDFLVERYLEDGGYCGMIRNRVTQELPPDMNYFDVKEPDGAVSRKVQEELMLFAKKILVTIADRIMITKVQMPWKRMFEVDLEAKYKDESLV